MARQQSRAAYMVALLLLLALAIAATPPDDIDDDELLERLLRRKSGGGAAKKSTAKEPAGPALDRSGSKVAVGYSAHQSGRNGGKSNGEYRKDSTDRQSLITQALFQEAQRERIRAADRDGKEEFIYVAANTNVTKPLEWTVACDLDFYSKAYGAIRGCTPSAPSFCRRIVRDSFAALSYCTQLREATERAMVNLFHRGGSTSLAPVHGKSAERLGVKGSSIFNLLLNKVRLQIMQDFGLDVLYNSGALLTRLVGEEEVAADEWEMERGHVYWNAHVDKANIATYDYSALLYLNEFGTDFEGGEFEFVDDDANRMVQPRAGRLILFTSGPENLHRVRRVVSGTRYVLAMWFTCSQQHQYSDDEPDEIHSKARRETYSNAPSQADAAVAGAEEELSVMRLVNEELLKANEMLFRKNHHLQRSLDALRSGGATAGEKDKNAKKQGDMLQEMALKRRLSAEVELAKKRLQAALAQERVRKTDGAQDSGAGPPTSSESHISPLIFINIRGCYIYIYVFLWMYI